MMSCKDIHDELIDMKQSTCPFCDQLLVEVNSVIESCCNNQKMFNDYGKNVCLECGAVRGYNYVREYVNFHENKYKFCRKSVYQRKYHIENIINDLCQKNGFQISIKYRDKILRIFKELDPVIHNVNKKRKRMININFFLRQIFLMLELPYKKIRITNSKKTLEKYNQYWIDILLLIFDKIIKIIQE